MDLCPINSPHNYKVKMKTQSFKVSNDFNYLEINLVCFKCAYH